MQYLHGKMMAVTSAARREMAEKQGMPLVSDLQKRTMTELEENSEVKRVKINPTDSKLQTENIVDEEWKRISLGIEKQARAVHLKATEATETKVGEFSSALKRTIINKPSSESKPTMPGNVSGSKIVTESQQKKITLSDNAPRAKQDQTLEKSREKRHRWDDAEVPEKRRKYDDDKRSRHKQSPSYRSTKSPPRSYATKSPPRSYKSKVSLSPSRIQPASATVFGGRKVWSLRDEKAEKYSSVSKDTGRKASTPAQSKDVIIVDDETQKLSSTVKAAEKSPVSKPSSSGQVSATSATTTDTSSAPSFKFGWKSKSVKPQLLAKSSVQYGPMPGRKLPSKGITTNCVF